MRKYIFMLSVCALPAFDELKDIKAITQFAAPPMYLDRPVVKNSPCKNSPPNQMEMIVYLEKLKTGKTKKKEIAGARLKDDEAMLKLFSQIHERDPKYSKEPWHYTKGTTVQLPNGCENVLCAMMSLYGNELGVQLLYMRAKYGFNASHLGIGEGDAWKPEDLGTVLAMLDDFPDRMHPVLEGTRFIHNNSEGRNGDKIIAESLVHVYLGWHKLPESEKTTSLAHELGHLFSIGRKDTPEWINMSGWTSKKIDEKKTLWTMGKPEQAVLPYALTNPGEDFGETFFMYRYNGAQMKSRFPDKYQYMRDQVFQGVEFDSKESCEDIP